MSETAPAPWMLKLVESEISLTEPWCDDELDRTKVAEALTNLVRGQSQPLTVALHGEWGTGKTFLLKRWRQHLENNEFKSIYFNAWEDDFCDDPFVAIIGQLSASLKEDEFKNVGRNIVSMAKLLTKNITSNLLAKVTAGSVDINELVEELVDNPLDEYSRQNENKKRLKDSLKEMAEKVTEGTGQSLVFIIDELDRCRPTFAIELLERVKHIFDIPGIVFVFGINQDELGKSVKSVYGNIDTETYLRRFFDMSLLLPEADIKGFCEYMMKKYELQESFDSLAGNNTRQIDFDMLSQLLPHFYNHLDLSLRDIDHCIRSLAFVGKSIGNTQRMYPLLVGALIFLRLKNQPLYRKFITGECFGAEVMDYINEVLFDKNLDDQMDSIINKIEVDLYFTDDTRGRPSLKQFMGLLSGEWPSNPEYFSKKTREMLKGINLETPPNSRDPYVIRARKFFSLPYGLHNLPEIYHPNIQYISSLIELTEINTRIPTI